MNRFFAIVAAFSAVAWAGYAQEILREGDASYASYTPWSKARTFDADGKVVRRGDQSRIMQNRPLYLVDKKSFPLPTNDWWTDALVSRWTGNLWSYPAKVVIGASGVRVAFPTYWIDNGTEVKERSAVVVGAKGAFNPDATLVESWHDWDVEMVLRDDAKSMRTTLVHGSPFTWIEYSGVKVASRREIRGRLCPKGRRRPLRRVGGRTLLRRDRTPPVARRLLPSRSLRNGNHSLHESRLEVRREDGRTYHDLERQYGRPDREGEESHCASGFSAASSPQDQAAVQDD